MDAAIDIYRNAHARAHRDQLILEHLDQVRHVLDRLMAGWPPGLDVENLESAGVLGLVQAADQFDPTRGVPFAAFANLRIRGAVIDEVRRNSPLPQEMLRRLGRIKEAFREVGPHATTQQLAAHARLSVREVESCLEAERLTRIVSGDDVMLHPVAVGNDETQQAAETRELQSIIASGIEMLPEQERIVVSLYFLEDLRLKEIGRIMSLSASRISRILSKAELRLAEYVRQRLE